MPLVYLDDIGIDDTSFTPGCKLLPSATLPTFIYSTTPSPYCSSDQSHCLTDTRQCLPKEQFCNFNDECRDRTDELSCPPTCTFENRDLCKWTHDTKEKLKWDFGTGSTSSINTGPSFGKSLFIELLNLFRSQFSRSYNIVDQRNLHLFGNQ